MDKLSGYLGADYFAKYFRQSTTRVFHVLEALKSAGMMRGSVLEVGALFGTFAGALQRAGYEVTAIDRYKKFGGALDGYIADMRSAGATVIATDAEHEEEDLATLGKFDVVMSMAVVEHIPHTPKKFLKSLKRHIAPGGLLIIDTPNIARYWNRVWMSEGKSIHQSIENQFHSAIPYEGHHREYTKDEVAWMLAQIGCTGIRTELFDYNLLQWDELTRNHIEALMKMMLDETLTDTVLAIGRC
jgi:2-polyprenyl-3-methyl-5-hydroxy-6-metoxy-1,4-benzoquinol methylase